jgi:hypothetical protein
LAAAEDEAVECAEAREQHQQHRAKNPAKVRNPNAGEVLAPNREDRHTLLEAHRRRHDPAVQAEVQRAEQRE